MMPAPATVFIGNIDDDPQNADWLLNANRVASAQADDITGQSPDEPDEFTAVSFAPKTVNGKIRIRVADLVKLGGPEGYIHGYICVRPPCGQAHEAEFNGKLGEVRHDGVRIGKMRKNDDGTYSMAHLGEDGKRTKLAARYATRADAAKSIALYHNVDKLHNEAADPEVKAALAKARAAFDAGDDGTATMYMAQAEAKAFAKGDTRLETHIRDTRAAIVDGPKAVNPPDVAGLLDTGDGPMPVPPPKLPVKHAPLPENVKQAVNDELFIAGGLAAFPPGNQNVKDRIASSRVAVDAGDADGAMKQLADAHDLAIGAGDDGVAAHIAIAHDKIALHYGLPFIGAKEPKAPEAPAPPEVPVPKVPKAPVAPRARNLPKAKAAMVDAELDAAQHGVGDTYSQPYQTIIGARNDVAVGELDDAREKLEEAHRALAGNPAAAPARDHIARADEVLADHLKLAPFQARTITHADEHAGSIALAAQDLGTIDAVGVREPRLGYLSSASDVAARLRGGDAGQVIRDLRELDARARERQGWEWDAQRKASIIEMRKTAKAVKKSLETLHKQDLSNQTFEDRADRLAQDIAPFDRSWRPAMSKIQGAAGAIRNGDLDDASRDLNDAKGMAGNRPKTSAMRQFEEDIANLQSDVDKAHNVQQVANLGEVKAEPVTGTGFLADTQNARNAVRAQLATAIKSGVASKKSPTVKGIMGETSIVKFKDGSAWVHKTPISGGEDESNNEELASLVARAIGARAPDVVRDPLDNKSVYMTLVNGKTAKELGETHQNLMRGHDEAADGMRRIGFMDYLIKNVDRHAGNFMIDREQMPVAIDHGNAWGGFNGSDVTKLVRKADFSPEYYAQVQKNLSTLESEFAKTGAAGTQKFNTMMYQLKKWMAWNDNGQNRPDC